MKRFSIGFWTYPDSKEKKFIWFEYLRGSCNCRFLTIFNILFEYFDKDCA